MIFTAQPIQNYPWLLFARHDFNFPALVGKFNIHKIPIEKSQTATITETAKIIEIDRENIPLEM